MKKFVYKIFDERGVMTNGVVEANSLAQAATVLKHRKVLIAKLTESTTRSIDDLLSRLRKPGLDEVSNFTRQLSTMIASGLPLIEALRILREQAKARMSVIIDAILTEVEGGSSLGSALEKNSQIFSNVYVALVKAGETAGVLDSVMSKMADTLDKQRDFRAKTKGALVYPVIVLIGMVVVATIMMIFVVPKMTDMYKDFGAKLPAPTRILIGMSNFMVNYWYILFGMLLAGFIFFRRWLKTPTGAIILEQLVLTLA